MIRVQDSERMVADWFASGCFLLMAHGFWCLSLFVFITHEEDSTLGDAGLYWFGAPLILLALGWAFAASYFTSRVSIPNFGVAVGMLLALLMCLPIVGIIVLVINRTKLVATLDAAGFEAGWRTVTDSAKANPSTDSCRLSSCSVCGQRRVRTQDLSSVCLVCLRRIA